MLDCITLCNTACIACIWCILFSVCFPNFSRNLRRSDSSECYVRHEKPIHRSHPLSRRLKADHARRRYKEPDLERDSREDRRGCRPGCREGRTYGRVREDRQQPISPVCSPAKCADGCNIRVRLNEPLDSKSDHAILRADSNEYHVYIR